MTASQIGYDRVYRWVKGYLDGTHLTVLQTVGWVVLCLLAAQQVSPAALARAIPAAEAGAGRSRLRRVRRWWQGPELELGRLAPRLIATALALLPPGAPVLVVLDTTRVGPWELWLAGVVYAGRVLPVGWAVLPYPWPKGRFRETMLALVRQRQAAFPAGQRWVLVADRGFPSAALFAQLLERQTGWTVRLRLGDWLEVAGIYAAVGAHLEAGRLWPGERVAATIGNGTATKPRVAGWVVVHAELPALPRYKDNPSTAKERAYRAHQRALARQYKGRKRRPPSERARRYAQTWVLFTTAQTPATAVVQYAARMAIEQTFRDWHHGWGLRPVAAGLPTARAVGRLVGIVSLAYRLQVELGGRLSRDAAGQRRRVQWTATDRLSLFWCGQQLFRDPGYDWTSWLAAHWDDLLAADAEPIIAEVAA